MQIELENDYHNTHCEIKAESTHKNYYGWIAIVDINDFVKAQNNLCGMDDCYCHETTAGIGGDGNVYGLKIKTH